MKKIFCIVSILWMFAFAQLYACDGCSGGSGSYYGILPQFHKSFIGLRYNTRSYTTRHSSIFLPLDEYKLSYERYCSLDIWARFYPVKRIQLLAFVPYNIIRTQADDVVNLSGGQGDASMLVNYFLLDRIDTIGSKKIIQTLLLGGGVKLPTGKFQSNAIGGTFNPAIRTGSGSVDYLFNFIYTVRLNKVGFNLDANYKINTVNKEEYKYGNRYNTSLKWFYWKGNSKISFLPHLGLYYEYAQRDVRENFYQEYSGGNALFSSIRLDVYFKKLNLGLSNQLPLLQNVAENKIINHSRWMFNMSYMFKK